VAVEDEMNAHRKKCVEAAEAVLARVLGGSATAEHRVLAHAVVSAVLEAGRLSECEEAVVAARAAWSDERCTDDNDWAKYIRAAEDAAFGKDGAG
jgi:hypothetical protein